MPSHADLPLHYGHLPHWLARRMSLLGGAIMEAVMYHHQRDGRTQFGKAPKPKDGGQLELS